MDYNEYYHKYLSRYRILKNSYQEEHNIRDLFDKPTMSRPNMSGGGSWGYFSDDNDSTLDLVGMYNITTYDEDADEFIRETSQTKINKILEKLWKDHDKLVKDIEKKKKAKSKIKDKVFSSYNLNTAHAGVIIYMLLYQFKIPEKYLKKTLATIYRLYFNIIRSNESSGWKEWEERLEALQMEIILLNYAINYGTPIKADKKFIKQNKISDVEKFCRSLKKKHDQGKLKLLDKIFLDKKRIKPKYSFMKYEILPPIDPDLLNVGDLMDGYEGRKSPEYYIVSENKHGKRKWIRYDPWEDKVGFYFSTDVLVDIFGKPFQKWYGLDKIN